MAIKHIKNYALPLPVKKETTAITMIAPTIDGIKAMPASDGRQGLLDRQKHLLNLRQHSR